MFKFSAPVIHINSSVSGIILTEEIIEDADLKVRKRLEGTIAGKPFNLSVHSLKTGEKYLMISKAFMRSLKVNFNEPLEILFTIADPEKIDFAEEFLVSLELDEEANLKFQKLTTGLKRSLNYYVVSAKSIDVRIKRSLELLNKLKNNSLYISKNKNEI